MRSFRFATAVIAATISVLLVTGAAVALTSGKVFYEAGKHAKPPYVFLTVSGGKVTKVRWDIYESCDGGLPTGFTTGVTKLNAPIKHGHFSRTVHVVTGGSPVAVSFDDTTVKGTISGRKASVKVSDNAFFASQGGCNGAHTFKATRTTRFH